MARDCPRCGLVNPPGAERCDCGYDFETQAGEPLTLTGRDTALLVARLITKGVAVLLVLAVVAIVQMFRVGANYRHALLLAGSLLSIAALFAYPARVARERGRPQRSLAGFLIGLGGLIPYLFGCYLVFYEGFWRLRSLLDGFVPSVVIVSVLYIVGGYAVVSAIYKATEFGGAVDEGRLKLKGLKGRGDR